MRKALLNTLFVLTASLFARCISTYDPAVGGDFSDGIPVVEGIITDDETIIKLSQSIALTAESNVILQALSRAQVWVESESGERFEGVETSRRGTYSIPTGTLDAGTRYRLRFTYEGEEFESDFRHPQPTPPIGEFEFRPNTWQMEVRINVNGEPDGPRHYMWQYEETWEIRAPYNATQYLSQYEDPLTGGGGGLSYKYVRELNLWYHYLSLTQNEQRLYSDIFNRPTPGRATYDRLYIHEYPDGISPLLYCWKYNTSGELLLGSTDMLTENRIRDHILYQFYLNGDRLSVLYHTKVLQYALADDAYFYFDNQKKNSEDTGSIFGPIPSEMQGNIVCTTSPDLLVIGFVEVSKRTQREVYRGPEYPAASDCSMMTEEQINQAIEKLFRDAKNGSEIARAAREAMDLADRYYLVGDGLWVSSTVCTNCVRSGGTKTRPDWWPNDHK